MLASALGVRLMLWVGAVVPRPAPPEALLALTRAVVTNDAADGDGFELSFALSKDRTLDYSLVSSGLVDNFNRVWIGVILGALPQALIDGIITQHQVQAGAEPGTAVLTVRGRDVGLMMDLKEVNASYPNQPDSVIVARLVAQHAQYGLVPQVTPTANVPIEIDRVPRQAESDLRFIRRMAARNGFVTYVEPQTFGVNTFYWGPEVRAGVPQGALNKEMGPYTNLVSLSFQNDGLAATGTEGSLIEPMLGLRLPIPSLPSLRLPPLSASPAQAQRVRQLRDAARQNPAEAATSAVAAVTNAPDAVRGEGEVDSVRYGSVLRARRLVGVRGAGRSYDGLYYTRRVTHVITNRAYTQQFVITREGAGSLLPAVPP